MTTETAAVGLFGPVDGMDEAHAEGSYFRLTVQPRSAETPTRYRISRAQAEELAFFLRELLA